MHAKNLIEKQMKIGRKIKEAKMQRDMKRQKVALIREELEGDDKKERLAVKSVLFDTQINNSFIKEQRNNRSLLML
jgi:hypothetical protein